MKRNSLWFAVDIIGRNLEAVEKAFLNLQREAAKVGLAINKNKTEYMKMGPWDKREHLMEIKIADIIFEWVNNYVFPRSELRQWHNAKIQRRILGANRSHFRLLWSFQAQIIMRITEPCLYKTLIRPVLAYDSESWTMPKAQEWALLCFERCILRKIFEAVYVNIEWRKRTNADLKGEADVVHQDWAIKMGWTYCQSEAW